MTNEHEETLGDKHVHFLEVGDDFICVCFVCVKTYQIVYLINVAGYCINYVKTLLN